MTIEVKPLNAIVYNQDKVNMNDVIAPPYDVILDDYREELYNRSLYNVVRLILAKGSKDLADKNNRYEEAAKSFKDWRDKEILIQTQKPAILPNWRPYLYGKLPHRQHRQTNFEHTK